MNIAHKKDSPLNRTILYRILKWYRLFDCILCDFIHFDIIMRYMLVNILLPNVCNLRDVHTCILDSIPRKYFNVLTEYFHTRNYHFTM